MDRLLDARSTIEHLGLRPHPEGGWYAETWRDDASSVIWFLLEAGDRSHWHRVKGSAEAWFHHVGDPLHLAVSIDGVDLEIVDLGPDLAAGQLAQVIVPPGAWQAATPDADGTVGYTLVSCTVAPPFRFDAFELAAPDWAPGR